MKAIFSTLIILVTGLVLTACAQQTELMPTKGQSPERYNQDRAACIKESNKYYGNSGGAPSESDVFLECMKSKGYQIKQSSNVDKKPLDFSGGFCISGGSGEIRALLPTILRIIGAQPQQQHTIQD